MLVEMLRALTAYDRWANERLLPRFDVLYERAPRQHDAARHMSFEMAA